MRDMEELCYDPDSTFSVGSDIVRTKRYQDGKHIVTHMRRTNGSAVIQVLSGSSFANIIEYPVDRRGDYREDARKVARLLMAAADDAVELPGEEKVLQGVEAQVRPVGGSEP